MGQQYKAICKECNESFTVREGGGFFFLLLHCEKCGAEKEIIEEDVRKAITDKKDRLPFKQEVEQYAGYCSKDYGKFTFKAKARCPKCNSDHYELHPDGVISFYD